MGRKELVGRHAPERPMRPKLVVSVSVLGDDLFGLLNICENVRTQAFVSELSLKRFNVRVVRRLSRAAKNQPDFVFFSPLMERTP